MAARSARLCLFFLDGVGERLQQRRHDLQGGLVLDRVMQREAVVLVLLLGGVGNACNSADTTSRALFSVA